MIDNALSEYLFAIGKDSPGKIWFHADFANRAPIYRALRIDPAQPEASFAITPFRLAQVEGRWLILAALPAPKVFTPEADWFDIETVVAWEPNSDQARVLNDPSDQFVGRLTDDANAIFASPRAFFQAWTIRRARFECRRQHTQGKAWTITPAEADDTPGALIVGELAKVRLSPSAMPEHIQCHGIDPKDLNRAIMRAARLPRATAASTELRSAA